MGGKQSRSTDKQHKKPDKKARKSTHSSRFNDENSAIAAADTQGGELITSEPQGGTANKHDETMDTLGTIPDTLSGQNELIDEPHGIIKKNGAKGGLTDEQNEIKKCSEPTNPQDGITSRENGNTAVKTVVTDIDVHISTQDYYAHDQIMDKDGGIDKVLGVMLAPVNKGESINLSIESTNGGDSSMQSSGMKVDYNKPLSEVLESIFSLSGKVLITFPNASYAEIRNHLNCIRRQLNQGKSFVDVKAAQINSELIDTGDTTRNRDTLDTRDTRDILDTEEIRDTTDTGEIQNINDTIVCSDTAHTTTMETMEGEDEVEFHAEEYVNIQDDASSSSVTSQIDINVQRVKIVTESGGNVLAVDAQTNQIIYNSSNDDDTSSQFFALHFAYGTASVYMFINVQTCLPVGVDSDNNLYSYAPTFASDMKDKCASMSYWLSKVCDILVQTTFDAPYNFMFKYTGQTPDLQLYPSDKTSSVGIGKIDGDVAAIVDSGYSGFTFVNIGFD